MSTHLETSGNDVEAIMHAVRDHTHALLGRTITYTAEDWAASSRLPGWTRSHVAAHLIQGARSLSKACRAVCAGEDPQLEDPSHDGDAELLALSDGLQLQIELDTSAGELDAALTQVITLTGSLEVSPGIVVGYEHLPLVRLRELIVHTFDLEPTETVLTVDPAVVEHVLAFEARYIAQPHEPMELVADEGFTTHIGQGHRPRIIYGAAANLLAWLARGIPLPEATSD